LKETDKNVKHKKEAAKLMNAGEFEKARREFEAALKESPGDPYSLVGIGATFYARNDYAQAMNYYKQALLNDPNFKDAFYNIACIYALQGKTEMAIKYLKIAAMNGFAEAAVMTKDPDLQSLKDNEEFKKLLRGDF